MCFCPTCAGAEDTVALIIRRLAVGTPAWSAIDADKALPWVEARLGVSLAAGQKEAVRLALNAKVLVVTGGPGVGKTTIIRSMLAILTAKGVNALLAAPTGRAAKRLAESTGREAKTIHRLLGQNPKEGGFLHGADNPLDCDVMVLDEVSMVDMPLMAATLKALPETAALVLVGDVDQLPSVGPGQVLADLIVAFAADQIVLANSEIGAIVKRPGRLEKPMRPFGGSSAPVSSSSSAVVSPLNEAISLLVLSTTPSLKYPMLVGSVFAFQFIRHSSYQLDLLCEARLSPG